MLNVIFVLALQLQLNIPTSRLVNLKQYSSNIKGGFLNALPDVIYLRKLAESEFRIIEQTNNLNKKKPYGGISH